MNTKIIKLDINAELLETITAKQGDTKSRFILFNLYDGAIPFDLSGRTVRVYGNKKDNTTVFNDLEINDAKNGYCTLELTNQMLAVEGMYELELVIFEGNKRLSTMPFILNVVGSKYSEDAIMSTNEFTALSKALQEVSDVSNKADKQEVAKLREQLEQIETNIGISVTTKNEILKEKKENILREKLGILSQVEIMKQSELLINTAELINLKQSESDYIHSINNLINIIDKLLEGGENNG